MEAVWRYATRTLALINVRRVAMGVPERQYTILDVPPLLLAPRDRREPFGPAQGKPFLLSNLPLDTPDGPALSHVEGQDVRWWWSRWYEPLRSILLVHTATGELGEEVGGNFSFSGGAVILNPLNVVIRERAAEARARRCFPSWRAWLSE